MRNNYLVPNIIRVNQTKNNLVPQIYNNPRLNSYEENEINSNYFFKSNYNNNYYNNRTFNKNNETLTIDNYNTKKLRHHQAKDSLNDQLNLIKFKMSCDLIGQKISQLKTFVDKMKTNDDEHVYRKKKN